jgi:hypothetical protein
MKRHQQIRKEQASLREKLEQKDIKVEDFVSRMRSLNEELHETEQKMYDEHNTCILSLDTKINLLQKENLLLNNKIGLLNISKENNKKINLKLIKKDKYIHKLKKSIKNDYLNFNEEMLPKSYFRISKRFPHLSLPEIIDFEKKVRENGGSIQVHSGKFRLTKRLIDTFNGSHCRSDKERHTVNVTWDCCHSVAVGPSNYGTCAVFPTDKAGKKRIEIRKCKEYERCKYGKCSPVTSLRCSINGQHHQIHRPRTECCGAIDLVNPQPDGQCDFPETFYLNEENEKLQDVKEVKVSDITTSISHNVKILEKTIEEYSEKIEKLKGLQETLDLLIDT